MINLKKKLKKQELSLGSWITLPDLNLAEMMSNSNFDWLAIDLEHSVVDLESLQNIIRVIDTNDTFPMVRLTSNDPNQVKRALDSGAKGIICPMINNRDDVSELLNSVYYPSKGKRSLGIARAQKYGRDVIGYIKKIEKELVTIIQIEHIDALNNLDEIFQIQDIDGYIIGPNDLSASMGIHGDLKNKMLIKAINEINSIAKKYKKPGGIHLIEPEISDLRNAIKSGNKFIAYSLDFKIFDKGLKEFMNFK